MKNQKQLTCPSCNSKNAAEYLYGMPFFDEKLQKQIDEGKVILAGCIINDNSPKYHCNDCGKDWGRRFEETINKKYY